MRSSLSTFSWGHTVTSRMSVFLKISHILYLGLVVLLPCLLKVSITQLPSSHSSWFLLLELSMLSCKPPLPGCLLSCQKRTRSGGVWRQRGHASKRGTESEDYLEGGNLSGVSLSLHCAEDFKGHLAEQLGSLRQELLTNHLYR